MKFIETDSAHHVTYIFACSVYSQFVIGAIGSIIDSTFYAPAVVLEGRADDFYIDTPNEDLYDEACVCHARNINLRHNPSVAISPVTTKIPLSFELDDEQIGPAVRNRLEGDANYANIYKKTFDQDLKSKEDGVVYIKQTLRPFFVKRA